MMSTLSLSFRLKPETNLNFSNCVCDSGNAVDAEPNRDAGTARLPGVEGEVLGEGPAVLLATEPLPADHERVAGGDAPPAHLCGVPRQLSLDPGPHRGRLLLLSFLRCDITSKPSIPIQILVICLCLLLGFSSTIYYSISTLSILTLVCLF